MSAFDGDLTTTTSRPTYRRGTREPMRVTIS